MHLFHSSSCISLLKTVGICVGILLLILCFGNVAKDILSIFFGGCIFAFILTPLSSRLERKLSRSLSAFISIFSIGLLLITAGALLLPLILRQLSSLSGMLPDALMRLRSLAESLSVQLLRWLPDLNLPNIGIPNAENQLGNIARTAVGAVSGAAGKLYRFILMTVLSCFLMADRDRILLRLELLVPGRWRRLAVRTGNILMRQLRLYLRGQATIALAVAILATSALTIIGVPGSPLLGLCVGLFNVIPYLGPFIGGIPAVLTALSIGWQSAALTLLALFLVQQIDGLVISPRVMGNITGFSPAVVLLAIFAGARIGNIAGMLLALPTLMAVRTVYRVFVQRHENN